MNNFEFCLLTTLLGGVKNPCNLKAQLLALVLPAINIEKVTVKFCAMQTGPLFLAALIANSMAEAYLKVCSVSIAICVVQKPLYVLMEFIIFQAPFTFHLHLTQIVLT